jgi:hypothetical protein
VSQFRRSEANLLKKRIELYVESLQKKGAMPAKKDSGFHNKKQYIYKYIYIYISKYIHIIIITIFYIWMIMIQYSFYHLISYSYLGQRCCRLRGTSTQLAAEQLQEWWQIRRLLAFDVMRLQVVVELLEASSSVI